MVQGGMVQGGMMRGWDDTGWDDAGLGCCGGRMGRSSNSKVAFGGIPHAGNPRAPYPSCDGILSFRISPIPAPRQPWSHPVMTAPTPALYVNGEFLSLVDQNLHRAHSFGGYGCSSLTGLAVNRL